jgi:hypothetical protein
MLWAVVGRQGLYIGTWQRRRDAIAEHCAALGKPWNYCAGKGDRVVKVRVTWRDEEARRGE